MKNQSQSTFLQDLLRRETIPVFSMYFFWGFGTGGLWLVRPLFAYETSDGSFLLVALISAVSALPRLVTSPLTGYLTDRFGRKPFVVLGSVLHIVAMVSDFFVDSYLPFLLLEVVGGIGISIWMTSANILMADNTRTETRGRIVAVRETSSRIGLLIGPAIAGVIGAVFGLRYIFFFIAACKVVVIVITVLWIKETRARRAAATTPRRPGFSLPHLDFAMFRTRGFLALAAGTFAVSMVGGGTGVFRTLFPPYTKDAIGLGQGEIGLLLSVAAGIALASTIPAGLSTDRLGRKRTLIVGMLTTALAVYVMGAGGTIVFAAISVVMFGLSEAFGWGTMQVYAMDLAPENKRGAFLGVWGFFQVLGQIAGPLLIGVLADGYGFQLAFTVATGILVAGAVMVLIFGPETRRRAH